MRTRRDRGLAAKTAEAGPVSARSCSVAVARYRSALTLCGATVLLFLSSLRAHAQRLPADVLFDVTRYGAKGDGISDDSEAIERAIEASQHEPSSASSVTRIVYFPRGTYRVSRTIEKRTHERNYAAFFALIGEDRVNTVIRLSDRALGFGQPQSPKAVVFTSSYLRGSDPHEGGRDYPAKGEGNDGYGNYIEQLTIDVGEGNAGAIGVDFLASNFGALRSVHVTASPDSGATGIALTRKWPGPLLMKDVKVTGFATGIDLAQREYGVTMDNVALEHQREVGLRNRSNVVSAHRLNVKTDAVGVSNENPDGLIVLDQSSLRCESPGSRGFVNAGQVVHSGLSITPASCAPPTKEHEHGFLRLIDKNPDGKLPRSSALNTPALPPLERWVSVADYGARPDVDEDASPGIREALQSGAPAVYFPPGRYTISEPVRIPSHVVLLDGLFSVLTVRRARDRAFGTSTGMVVADSGGMPLLLRRFLLDHTNRGTQVGFQHSGSRTVAVRDLVSYGVTTERTADGGILYLENTCCSPLMISGPKPVIALQLDSEGRGTRIENHGAPLRVTGLKTEGPCTAVHNFAAARTQVSGGLIYQVRAPERAVPAFINDAGARFDLTYAESAYRPGSAYEVHVLNVSHRGQPKAIRAVELPQRGMARFVLGARFQSK